MEIVGLKIYTKDLVDFGPLNFWGSKNCSQAENDIIEYIISATGSMPCKNMALVKLVSFSVGRDVTIPELRNLGEKIYKCFGIECFQISIDRNKSMANMLFDFVDRKTAKSVYMNVSNRKLLSALIAKELNSNNNEDAQTYLRYKILLEYKEDTLLFSKIKSFLANTEISSKGYSIIVDILDYMEHICNGRTVLKSK